MERLGKLPEANAKVLADATLCIEAIKRLASTPFDSSDAAVAVLKNLRSETYEDLNQIQHEHLVLRAAGWLLANTASTSETEWFWNPRQTGDAEEPDLLGRHRDGTVISAEITTSQWPNGAIDARMASTLQKLSRAPGTLYYFVQSDAMARRAATKVGRAGWPIQVVMLAG